MGMERQWISQGLEGLNAASSQSTTQRRWGAVGAALAACVGGLVIVLAYWNALDAAFVWDDHILLGPNSPVASGKLLEDPLGLAFWQLDHRQETRAYYRPLSILSLALDAELWGDGPRGFHATNLLLHGLVCLGVFALARRMGAGVLASTLAMVLFGTFPRLTESVTFISGRTDLLASLAVLCALALHRVEPHAWGRRGAAAAALFFGLLAKEVAAAGIAAIALLEITRRSREAGGWKHVALHMLPLAMMLTLYLGLRVHSGVQAETDLFPRWPERGLFVVQALGHYLWMLLTPWNPQLVIGTLGILETRFLALGASALALLTAVGLTQGKTIWSPERVALLALALFALLPVLHLAPLPIRAVAADRFLYLPLAALAILLASLSTRVPTARSRWVATGCALLALGFASATHARNRQWSDELTLWRETARHMSPANGQAEFELGNLLGQRGQTQQALEHYRRSLALELELKTQQPEYPLPVELLSNFGLVLAERGHSEEAIPLLEDVVRQRPHEPLRHFQLASALSRSLDFRGAERHFARALELHPNYSEAAQLRAQNRRAAALWRRLPAPSAQESLDVKAARADVYFLVGRLGRANELRLAVVTNPRASASMIHAARRGLELQREVVGETVESRALATALANR